MATSVNITETGFTGFVKSVSHPSSVEPIEKTLIVKSVGSTETTQNNVINISGHYSNAMIVDSAVGSVSIPRKVEAFWQSNNW
jgi:hypothetical protein